MDTQQPAGQGLEQNQPPAGQAPIPVKLAEPQNQIDREQLAKYVSGLSNDELIKLHKGAAGVFDDNYKYRQQRKESETKEQEILRQNGEYKALSEKLESQINEERKTIETERASIEVLKAKATQADRYGQWFEAQGAAVEASLTDDQKKLLTGIPLWANMSAADKYHTIMHFKENVWTSLPGKQSPPAINFAGLQQSNGAGKAQTALGASIAKAFGITS